ncbi:GPI transamidase component-like protein [Xylariaceae sp. FL1651]|nr:GPI transamidase component-like protein [Xylariaceae sp. FL1651]
MNHGKMSLQNTAGLYGAAAALRLALFTFFPGLPDLLTGRVEVSTPVTSFKRLQEGLFLYNHNVSPYDGGVYHQAPLLLPLFSLFPDPSTYPFFTYLLYILVDIASADALCKIAESGEAAASKLFTSARKDRKWSGYVVAAIFLFNPFTIATCLGRPTNVFTTCAILHAIAKAITGNPFAAILALSFATYLSMYPILLLPPLVLLAYDRQHPSNRISSLLQFAGIMVSAVTVSLSALFAISYFLTGSWEFFPSTYGIQLTLTDLTPNVGLWWYFFIEMFDSFRSFFLGVFWLHLSSYVGGLSIRVRSQPLAVLTILLGICSIFKPYPSIADISLFLAMVPLFRHVFPLMRYTFFAASTILYSAFLGPAFYYLWIYAGSGNANFFYAITLVWSLGQSLLVSDLTFAVLRDEWEVERPEMVGKEIKQI